MSSRSPQRVVWSEGLLIGPEHMQQLDTDAALLPKHAGSYRAWSELLKRTIDIDVLDCPKCHGRMKLLAMVTDGKSVERYLAKLGEPTQVPGRSPSRGPPYWKSRVLRLKAMAGQG